MRIKSKFTVLLALLIVFVISASGCSVIQKTPEAIAKENVAKVGNDYITRGDLDKAFKPINDQLVAQYGADYFKTDEGKQLLQSQRTSYVENMIELKIFEQKADEYKVYKSDDEIQADIQKEIDNYVQAYGSQDAFQKELDANKITQDQLKEILRGQVIANKVMDYIFKDLTVPEKDMQDYYNANKDTMTTQPNTMDISKIVVASEQEAKDLKARADKGEDFANLAKMYSTDTATKDKGGSMGTIQDDDTTQEAAFMTAAKALKEGEVSAPVQTSAGYVLIKVTKKNDYPIKTYDQAKDDIKAVLLQQAQQKKYDDSMAQWKKDAKVTTYDKNINNYLS